MTLANGRNGEKGWPEGWGGEDWSSQLAGRCIKMRLIDALANALRCIGTDVDGERWWRWNGLLLPEGKMQSGLGVCRRRKRRKTEEESTAGEHWPIPSETTLVRLEGESPSRLLAVCRH